MFWEGFYKKAAKLQIGTKSLRSMVGNRASTGVSIVGATKPNLIPTASGLHATSQISAPKLTTNATIKEVPKAKGKHSGVGETRI